MFGMSQITYGSDTGYLYLAEDLVVSTDELKVNNDLNLDFGAYQLNEGVTFYFSRKDIKDSLGLIFLI